MADEPRRPTEEEMRAKLDEKLIQLECRALEDEELIGARLYTGPLYVKYNLVLRSSSGAELLRAKVRELCRGNRCSPHSLASSRSCVSCGDPSLCSRQSQP